MKVRLLEHLTNATIEHIGSTSVPGLPAKPVVDLAVGVSPEAVSSSARQLALLGFDLEGERADHAWLSFPDRSCRAFVIHLFDIRGEEWTKRLRFRDILLTDASSRAKYLSAKRAAAASTNGWGDYTKAKSAVVAEILDGSASEIEGN